MLRGEPTARTIGRKETEEIFVQTERTFEIIDQLRIIILTVLITLVQNYIKSKTDLGEQPLWENNM